ncbi:hypothetical protein B0H16DRAFT_1744844 [Mycena metata]|uniref:Uncharacterized protein n=1 Tax=Mycena metata TaxID=1033252 RepID=A0AAD7H4K6_9AGAR|nr:hypothetical protein B0H16DRAFT_1744844 [Mycena metata]
MHCHQRLFAAIDVGLRFKILLYLFYASSFIVTLNKAIDRPFTTSEAELAAIEVEDELDAEENALANNGIINIDGG